MITIDINQVLAHYDAMFGKYSLSEIEEFLIQTIAKAKEQSKTDILVALLNEIIGFYRDTTQKKKALKYCSELQSLLKILHLEGSIPYATSLLNIANAYRAFGLHKESLSLFEQVFAIYEATLDRNDFMFASLYNNWALVYQEIEDYEQAKKLLLKALNIVDLYKEAKIPQATTRTNLASSFIGIGSDSAYNEAIYYLKQALDIFEKDGGKDFHYGAALVAMGDACRYKKEYDKSGYYYKKGLEEIEKHTGKNANYDRVLEKYHFVKQRLESSQIWISNMEKSRVFYESSGKPMIETLFPEYINRIAVGLVGEGSDCFEFDDEISMDHDYDVGFCMWLTEKDFQKIGSALQKAYSGLVETRNRLHYRRGVFSINEFYNHLLETDYDFETDFSLDYAVIKESNLAAVTNGQVFQDHLGLFSKIRNQLLDYYPNEIWRKKLAQNVHEFSQYAQSNYARMMARNDSVTSMICIGKAIESVLDIIYLLENKYAPYYKWKKKGLEYSSIAKKILPILEEIAKLPNQKYVWESVRYSAASIHMEDANIGLFEQIAETILDEMKRQQLVSGNDNFLEYYVEQILEGKNMDIIKQVIAEEWKQFDQVKNEGGRADCQDNYETFSIMRKSQYMTWTREMLESFYDDLTSASKKGWNLIMEKYARMMKNTSPKQYIELESELPILSDKRIAIQEELIKVQVNWMEEFAKKYPNLAMNSRSIRSIEDSEYNTSYETYLRGEMSTYSERTFLLYTNFIIHLLKENRNLALETMTNTVKMYGYASIDDAESIQKIES